MTSGHLLKPKKGEEELGAGLGLALRSGGRQSSQQPGPTQHTRSSDTCRDSAARAGRPFEIIWSNSLVFHCRTEAQRREETCPRSHSKLASETRQEGWIPFNTFYFISRLPPFPWEMPQVPITPTSAAGYRVSMTLGTSEVLDCQGGKRAASFPLGESVPKEPATYWRTL